MDGAAEMMLAYSLRRLGWAIFVVFAVVTLVFVLMNAIGDPAVATLGPRAGRQQLQDFRASHGLDQPLAAQYLTYLGKLAHGDLGRSYQNDRPVTDVIKTRLPRSLLLGTLTIAFELLFGLTLGILAAVRRNTWFDTGFMTVAFLGISAPSFLLGLVFLDVFAFRLGWFPVGGLGVGFWDEVHHALLPALTLAVLGAATYARLMRSEMIETLQADYVRTAKAKGLAAWHAVLGHAARNAILPVVTVFGMSLSFLVSGAIVTEAIFSWPGIGRLAVESIYSLDGPTVMGVVIIACIAVQVGNFLADIAVAWLDPRIRDGA